MAAFLKGHRYSRKTPAQLLERLRAAPTGRAGEIETCTRRAIVIRLVHTLEVLVEQIHGLQNEIGQALDAHPDGEIFRSFFKTDAVICAATLLAEIGDCRRRYPHRDAIAADAAQAPVAKESGKRKHATFRWACKDRLRNALSTLAHCSCRGNRGPRSPRQRPQTRAQPSPRATHLGRAWARIIWRCWQNRTPDDPARTPACNTLLVTIPAASGLRPDPPATHRMAGSHPARYPLTQDVLRSLNGLGADYCS